MTGQHPTKDGEHGGAGRPSVAEPRRRQILDAFIDLIASAGLESVTLDDVATRAGVQRSVIRHYVGNRSDLIAGAVHVLTERYTNALRAALGPTPTAEQITDFLFSPTWTQSMAPEDRALDVVFHEATRHEATRTLLKSAYQTLIDELANAIRRDHHTIAPEDAEDAAYQIICLAEHNIDMQELGFSPHHAAAAHQLARHTLDRLTLPNQ